MWNTTLYKFFYRKNVDICFTYFPPQSVFRMHGWSQVFWCLSTLEKVFLLWEVWLLDECLLSKILSKMLPMWLLCEENNLSTISITSSIRIILSTLHPVPCGKVIAFQVMKDLRFGFRKDVQLLASKVPFIAFLLMHLSFEFSKCQCCSERQDSPAFAPFCVSWQKQGYCHSGGYIAWMHVNCHKTCTCTSGKVICGWESCFVS